MKPCILSLVLLLSLSCSSDKNPNSNLIASVEANDQKNVNIANKRTTGPFTTDPYKLMFDVQKRKDDAYDLIVNIELNDGAHFVSPHAKQDFKGKFYMDLGSYTHLDFDGDILETPPSVEEFDSHPFVNGLVNWVRVNTTYRQTLKIKSDEDFKVFGRVRFTIEPRCTLEEIPFGISYENGILTFFEPKC
ncbi:hypothetical protein ACFS5M_07670 [Lacinutrix iliipiscaria]|uniref:Lipoprotein n=1 Tax=Lacinutrix iliipiscaria TaxID=1230532 RepID=A0ABW5WLI3_9FLAO